MNLLKAAILSTVLACASTAHALEATASNDVKNAEVGMGARLAALVAAFNDLRDTVNTFADRITATETDLSLIKNNGAKNEVQRWNPKLEARLDAIESRITTLEGASTADLKLVYKKSVAVDDGETSSYANNDLCFLSRVNFTTTSDNHAHSCTIQRSSSGYRLISGSVKGDATCTMLCYDLQ